MDTDRAIQVLDSQIAVCLGHAECAEIAEALALAKAALKAQGEPVYQCRYYSAIGDTKCFGKWFDCDRDVWESATHLQRRILYTAPQPVEAQGEPFGYVVENGRDKFFYTLSGAQEHQQDYGGKITRLYNAQQPESAMRPKRLEWQPVGDSFVADTEFGRYEVAGIPSWLVFRAISHCRYDNPAEAKAAAQADYDKRAMACFEESGHE